MRQPMKHAEVFSRVQSSWTYETRWREVGPDEYSPVLAIGPPSRWERNLLTKKLSAYKTSVYICGNVDSGLFSPARTKLLINSRVIALFLTRDDRSVHVDFFSYPPFLRLSSVESTTSVGALVETFRRGIRVLVLKRRRTNGSRYVHVHI